MYACIHAPDAGALAQSFSPWVEMLDPTTAVFSITPRQLARLEALTAAHIAVAATAEAAILAARNLPGLTFLPPGREAEILGALPLDCLPPDPEIFQTLDLWGIRSLADLARLPEDGIAARLGDRGLRLQKLARGAIGRPLRPVLTPATYEESAEFDHPIELREPLLFLIGRFLFDLSGRLKSQSLAALELHLTLNAQERKLGLPFPTRDVKLLLKLVEHSLERQPPEEPIERVRVELIPTQPRRVQHDLFTPAAPEPEKLELTLGKIRALVGDHNAGYPQLFDTHRPGAGHPAYFLPRLAFRHFRPPLEARVDLEAGRPIHIWTKMFRGRVIQAAGPWRSGGDWWDPTAWNRDEWDIALSDSTLYRIFTGHLPLAAGHSPWFVEGLYD